MTTCPVVLYHAKCDDGFGAAYAAWLALGNDAVYLPVSHGDSFPLERVVGSEVFILDFSYSPDVLAAAAEVAHRIVLLDHHVSAARQWQGLETIAGVDVVFDMGRSGAQMAWDYFHPESARPALIDHIGDQDLWRFWLPDTRAFCAGLGLEETSFQSWQLASAMPERLIERGRIVLEFRQRQVQSAVEGELRQVQLCGHTGLAANVIENVSEIGHQFALQSGTFGLAFQIKGDTVACSLRSVAPFDVSEIAGKYGGGGHAQASGFRLSVERFFSEIWIAE